MSKILTDIGLTGDKEVATLRFFFTDGSEQSIGLELKKGMTNEEVGQRLIKVGTMIGIWEMPKPLPEEGSDAGN